jgi:hypothetical protein
MNTPGLLKCAGAVVVLVIVSACGSALRQPFDGVYPERSRGAQGDKAGGDMTVAPSATTVNATYVGRTLFVNGRPITAARLNPLPRYAELVPDKSKSKNYEYIFNYYDTYASISAIRRAFSRSARLTVPAAKGAPTSCTAMERSFSGTPGVRTT